MYKLTKRQLQRVFYSCILKKVLPTKCTIDKCIKCGVVSARIQCGRIKVK